MRGASDLPAFDVGEVAILGEVLTHESVGVLVETPFPGAIGMREEEVGIERLGNGFVSGEFGAVVGGDREDLARMTGEAVAQGTGNGRGSAPPEFAQQCVFRPALDRREQSPALPMPDHGVGFPVAHAALEIDRRRPLIDGNAVGEAPAPVVGPVALAPCLLAAQVPMQVPARVFVGIDMPVDPFVTDDNPVFRL